MIELPEAMVLSGQLRNALMGKTVEKVITNASPHKFAWFYDDPKDYEDKLMGRKVTDVHARAGQVEMVFEDMHLTFSDGVNLRLYEAKSKLPDKHQLLLRFNDQSVMACSVQMYGGLMAFAEGENQNPYYLVAGTKPSPLTEAFSADYFNELIGSVKPTLSLKAFLATEQRIPGLGNGVLQDILYEAGIHPKRKVGTLSSDDAKALYLSIKQTLASMVELGGRDTEKNLYGEPGGYQTRLSSKSQNEPCYKCGDIIHKESFMGGSIYYCGTCQK